MGLLCGAKCVKVLLIAFNLLLWACGCAMVVVASWVFVAPTMTYLFRLASTRDVSPYMIYHVAYSLIALGCAVLLVGFFGCCGAVQGSKCMLAVFFVLLFLLLCLEAAAAVATLVVRDKFLGAMEGRLARQLASRYGHDTANNSGFTEAVDLMQYKLHCCGIHGDGDYNSSRWKDESQGSKEPKNVPLTCCVIADDQVTNSGSPISVVSRVFSGTVSTFSCV
ncbi:tetraspanin-1-like isoform X2 [Bacillus rossius redtenbacheri]|uniref:tetraspanin-1-like isoform X2 n=1 Tax=Bacillus rossius redtenbacheri TaxID=93214 RepID=UPI002FDEA809